MSRQRELVSRVSRDPSQVADSAPSEFWSERL